MRILIINPPHPAIGSRIPDDHLPPLGLLSVGGPLIDDGHEVSLLDAEFGPMRLKDILLHIRDVAPDLLLIGHSGSTTAHPVSREIASGAKIALPRLRVIYGGVFPTYHWRDVLKDCPEFDYIVRGEGEETGRQLVRALEKSDELSSIQGIAFRLEGRVVSTPARTVIGDLDEYRVGWELIRFEDYSYWGRKRAVVVQFSRGCPHPCNYCGQRGFWTKWRHRNPERFAAEIARLRRDHGVEVFNFAQSHHLQHFADSFFSFGFITPFVFDHWILNVFSNGKRIKQCTPLKQHCHAAANVYPLMLFESNDRLSKNFDFSDIGF